MQSLARGEVVGCSNPLLDVHVVVGGVLLDAYALEYVISERVTSRSSPTQVYPPVGRQTADVDTLCPAGDKLGTGHYVAEWTVPVDAVIGLYQIDWYFTLEDGGVEYLITQEFEVITEKWVRGRSYASVLGMRDEGVTTSHIADAALHQKLVLASQFFDVVTGRHFYPRRKALKVDGSGCETLLFEEPIIAIESVIISGDFVITDGGVNLDNLRVYNRHLTQHLLEPDDRESPRIEFAYSQYPNVYRGPSYGFEYHVWPRGTQNIHVTGVFGYTEPDGSTTGREPLLVQRAVQLLTYREIPSLADVDEREDAQKRWRLTGERTRDQSYSLFSGVDAAARGAMVGAITGDPEIDRIIIRYKRGPRLGSA